jgi:hypothetical protein
MNNQNTEYPQIRVMSFKPEELSLVTLKKVIKDKNVKKILILRRI